MPLDAPVMSVVFIKAGVKKKNRIQEPESRIQNIRRKPQ
jgi:hypothetical protein